MGGARTHSCILLELSCGVAGPLHGGGSPPVLQWWPTSFLLRGPRAGRGRALHAGLQLQLLERSIVHLNIKYGLWFQSEIFVGFYKTTTNKQSKQQQKSDTFQAGFFFPFSFARWYGDLHSVNKCSKEGHFSNGVLLCSSLIHRLPKELYIKVFQEAGM